MEEAFSKSIPIKTSVKYPEVGNFQANTPPLLKE